MTSSSVIVTQSWLHVAAVYEHNARRFRIYLNGALDGEATFNVAAGAVLVTNVNPVSIGRRRSSSGGPGANGRIDDVRIYDRALSDLEINDLARSRLHVAIDIVPGDPGNEYDASATDQIPVAILSSDEFDATDPVTGVDPETLTLAGAKVQLLAEGDAVSCTDPAAVTDVNGDAMDDLSCLILIALEPTVTGESIAVLEAETLEGFPVDGRDRLQVTALTDTDGDGLFDQQEKALGTDPKDPDTDNDGVRDGDEEGLGLDPLNPDTDGDSFLDGGEIRVGVDPTVFGPFTPGQDFDRDGVPNPFDPNSSNPDIDRDRLLDGNEFAMLTNLFNPDTDGDGRQDGRDSDPLDPNVK